MQEGRGYWSRAHRLAALDGFQLHLLYHHLAHRQRKRFALPLDALQSCHIIFSVHTPQESRILAADASKAESSMCDYPKLTASLTDILLHD